MAFEKISVPSVREAFVQAIEDKILSGELKVGERLPPARQLSAEMGISLTVISAGMSELAAKGLWKSSRVTAFMWPITACRERQRQWSP